MGHRITFTAHLPITKSGLGIPIIHTERKAAEATAGAAAIAAVTAEVAIAEAAAIADRAAVVIDRAEMTSQIKGVIPRSSDQT